MEPSILGRSRQVNEYMPFHLYQKFLRFLEATGRQPQESRVFVVEFAFKGWPETSDMRNSSTLELVRYLRQAGVKLLGFDPVVNAETIESVPGVQACSLVGGFQNSDCMFIMNNHPSYEDWNLHELMKTLRKPSLFVDGWHMFRIEDITRVEGVSYSSVSQDQGWPETAKRQVPPDNKTAPHAPNTDFDQPPYLCRSAGRRAGRACGRLAAKRALSSSSPSQAGSPPCCKGRCAGR